jgi:hypothetical protein
MLHKVYDGKGSVQYRDFQRTTRVIPRKIVLIKTTATRTSNPARPKMFQRAASGI